MAFIDGIFEWQLAQNEASTELKSSLHIRFVLGGWVIGAGGYSFLGWLNSMGTTRDIHDKLKNIQ